MNEEAEPRINETGHVPVEVGDLHGHEVPSDLTPQYRRTRKNIKPIVFVSVGALLLAVVAIIVLEAVDGSPPPITTRGRLQISGDNAHEASQDFPDITDGTQVVVTDSSGTVIGTGMLGYDQAASQDSDTGMDRMLDRVAYHFTVTVPGGEPRYGVRVSTRGTVWFTPAQFRKGPALSLSGSGGQ